MLKIYADAESIRRTLKYVKRAVIVCVALSLFIGGVFLYIMINQVEGFRFLTGLGFLLLAFVAWVSYYSILGYEEVLKEVPLLYSFHSDGFIFHRSERHFSWEQVASISFSKTNINLQIRNLPRNGKRSFNCIATKDVQKILIHFKEYAPERLAKNIKT